MMPDLRLASLGRAFGRSRASFAACPHCGWTLEKAQETALFGCPLCYEALDVLKITGNAVFGDQISP